MNSYYEFIINIDLLVKSRESQKKHSHQISQILLIILKKNTFRSIIFPDVIYIDSFK